MPILSPPYPRSSTIFAEVPIGQGLSSAALGGTAAAGSTGTAAWDDVDGVTGVPGVPERGGAPGKVDFGWDLRNSPYDSLGFCGCCG